MQFFFWPEYNKFAFMLLGGLSKRANEGLIDYFIVPRHDGGSDTPENSVGLCMLDNIGKKKKYAIVMPFISGFETALIRK